MTAMRNENRSSSITARSSAGPTAVSTDRRSRVRLRDLCDEVLASFRVAANRELFSEDDRIEGRALFTSIASMTLR
jgi:hypothetical protein